MQKAIAAEQSKSRHAQRSKLARAVSFIVAALVVGAAAFTIISRRPIGVSVAGIERAVPIRIYGLGTVEARILSEIGFEVGAALSELHADHGDRVAKDQVLARLHSAEQEAKVAKAKAGVVNAEAALAVAESAVGRAKAILAQKESINQRRQALLGRQITSIEAAGEAEKEEIVARADVATASANIEVARAHLADAKAQHDYEKVLLEHHVLAAPYDALVVKRHKELGAVLKAGETLFTLIDPKSVWALAYVDEVRAGEIQVGQPAEVKLRSRPRDVFQARVIRIGIESDRVSEERRVYVKCEQCPESGVHLGEQVEVFITTGTLDEAQLVPEHAILAFDGVTGSVWTVENGRLQKRQVRLGSRTLDGRVVITGGLPDGVRPVTNPPKGAVEGRAARIAAGAAP
jgi:HlyD family secretion protein